MKLNFLKNRQYIGIYFKNMERVYDCQRSSLILVKVK